MAVVQGFAAIATRLPPVWGEYDAAWIGVGATHPELASAYWTKSSVLYLYFLFALHKVGVSWADLPLVANWVNVLIVIPFVWVTDSLFRRLLRPGEVWLAHAFVFFFPATWLNRAYGFPGGIAALFFVVGLSLLWRKQASTAVLVASTACFATAIGFKMDFALCAIAPAAWGVRELRRGRRWVVVLPPILGPIIAVAGAILNAWRSGALGARVLDENAKQVNVADLRPLSGMRPNVASTGTIFFLAGVVAFVWLGTKRERRDLVIFSALWMAPSYVFWSFHSGNSARHLTVACLVFAPLCAALCSELAVLARRSRLAWVPAGALALANYYSGPRPLPRSKPADRRMASSLVAPSTQVFRIPRTMSLAAQELHATARHFVEDEAPRRVWVRKGAIIDAYVFWEVAAARSDGRLRGHVALLLAPEAEGLVSNGWRAF